MKGYSVGRIYSLNPVVDLSQLDVKDANRYKRMKALKVVYFVAVRKTSDKRTVFAPLNKEYIKKSVKISVGGECFYATYSALPKVPTGCLIECDITDKVSPELLEEIKFLNAQW